MVRTEIGSIGWECEKFLASKPLKLMLHFFISGMCYFEGIQRPYK